MSQEQNMHYWLDQLVNKILNTYSDDELIVSSGVSPSGMYHVGHSREILTADAIYRAVRESGRKIRHLHFVDDIEALRKRYPYLPESYEQEAGKPLYMIPAPDGKSKSYADQYFNDFYESSVKLGVDMEVIRTSELYSSAKFSKYIELAINKKTEIAEILKRVSGREVGESWVPIQIVDESSGKLNTAKYIGFNAETSKVHYIGFDGNEHFADIKKGDVKLDWRLDWPARWKIYGVNIEGFGREHATKGGSYDTGSVIAKEVFGIDPPYPVPYETINLKGETKKMSSSLGNLITLKESLQFIPAEILRYFTFKSRPEKQLLFDPGMGLYVLMDEYAKTESETINGGEPEFKRAWQIANLSGNEHVISTVPFSHMVTAYQSTRGDVELIKQILTRSGHERAVETQLESIEREIKYIAVWLDKYAPDNIKFDLQDNLPALDLSDNQKKFLELLSIKLEDSDMKPEVIHSAVYDSSLETQIKPAEAFKLIYRLFLDRDQGPKVGFFLSSLGKDFVISRIKLQS